jgi:replicative DNA helicase
MLEVIQGGKAGRLARGRGRGRGGADGGPPIIHGRPPPHDLDAEAAVLSAILLSADALDRVAEALQPEHFYSDANGKIYEAALTLAAEGTPIDAVTIASWLRAREQLGRVGGPTYIAQLADATPAVANIGAHAHVVSEKWRLRRVIATCQRVAAEGYGDVGEVQSFIDGAEQSLYQLAHSDQGRSVDPLSALLRDAFRQVVEAADRGERLSGIATGYTRLDEMMSGLHPGDFTVVAGRPGMGKSAFALNVAAQVASPRRVPIPDVRQPGSYREVDAPGLGVVVFSLEMPREQLALRTACSEGAVDLGRIRAGSMRSDDWTKLSEACRFLSKIPVWIDDTPAIGLLELRAKVRRIQAEYNRPATSEQPERKVGVVIIDYLQLMSGSPYAANREQEIAEISRGLKRLAKELGVAVVALSQLNRSVETRSMKDKRPQLSDLRESGSLEQDSDNVIFIYRDDYYHPTTSSMQGLAEIIVAKQRNGPTGKVFLRFFASCTRFANPSPSDVLPEDDA